MLNRFKDLGIKRKLICGFGISGLLLLIIGGMSFAGLNRLNGQVEFIYKTNVIPITILSDLRAAMLQRSNAVLWHLVANDAATMEAREKTIVEFDNAIEDLLSRYEPAIVTESERKLFEQLQEGAPGYKNVRKKVLEFSRTLRKDRAAEVQKVELTEKLAVLFSAVDGLVAENERQARASHAASQSLSAGFNWTMIALNITAVLIGVWTVWFVSKLIVENLTNVLDAAQQLRQGNLMHRSTVTAQDEIGRLATAFNQMAETLQDGAAKQDASLKAQHAQASELRGVMGAIGTSQAIIEFNLDGTVIDANENFLACVGYRLEEIKGQHHRMFCDPVYASTAEYTVFWQKLNRGEFDASAYRRVGKQGKEIWLQASYNPIKDETGRPRKVIVFATDITVHKNRNAEYKSKLVAINQSQAIIEFNLDGTVIDANENFLACMGYRLEEIKGQHHRMFCDPAYTSTGEYTAFWQKLKRGEFEAGMYRRLGKHGNEIWIQASYNPILDANGKVYKIVKYATDITVDKNRNAEYKGKLIAINQSQAAIEFKLDGTVITANENFLACMGYRLEEIEGQHHRMFCDPAYTSTGEYAAFWQKLNRGEFETGVYRRLGKHGKEIWIQASYNPILDANGKVYKVVKYATEVTAQKKAQTDLEACMQEAQQALMALAQGDLSHVVQGTYEGELDKIKVSINTALANLTNTMSVVREAVEAVSTASEQITKGNQDLSQRTSEQASALEETAASMEEMTSTVKQNADNTKRADQLAIAARETADKGGAVTQRAVEAMGEINNSSKKIADIITVIDEIAFQTNLLALNAAVEAARAGEHGRGFAVVAAEVRNLAQRSATAAKEIKGLINESIQRVGEGSELVNQSGKTLEEVVLSVKRVNDIIAEISAASQEQASGIDQVNKAMMAMDDGTQQNAALVEETTSAAQSMKEQAKELLRQVETFKFGKGDERSAGQTATRRHAASAVTKPAAPAHGSRVGFTKPVAGKSMERKEPAHVASGNGKDRRDSGDDFEEF